MAPCQFLSLIKSVMDSFIKCAYFHIFNLSCPYSVDFLSFLQPSCFWKSWSVFGVTGASHTCWYVYVTDCFSFFFQLIIFSYVWKLLQKQKFSIWRLTAHLPIWSNKNVSFCWTRITRAQNPVCHSLASTTLPAYSHIFLLPFCGWCNEGAILMCDDNNNIGWEVGLHSRPAEGRPCLIAHRGGDRSNRLTAQSAPLWGKQTQYKSLEINPWKAFSKIAMTLTLYQPQI